MFGRRSVLSQLNTDEGLIYQVIPDDFWPLEGEWMYYVLEKVDCCNWRITQAIPQKGKK